jgi:ABC-type hemin transport system ATPase subunit
MLISLVPLFLTCGQIFSNIFLLNINFRVQQGAGKSTLMTALRGTLELMNGERVENEKLR